MILNGQCQGKKVDGGGQCGDYVTHVTLISLLSPIQGDWHMDSGLTIVLGIIGLITLYLHIMWMSALDGVSIGTRTRMLVA